MVSTVGFSMVKLKRYRHYNVLIYDLGGGDKIRDIWRKYYAFIHGVIFVMDSTDISRMMQVKDVLENVVAHDKISRKPILL